MAPRPCIDCGRRIAKGSRCPVCEAPRERQRQERQPYRAAYGSPEYRQAKKEAARRSGGQCEAFVALHRCPRPATEFHHVIPLSRAQSLAGAIALCRADNLAHVCQPHNPRGGRR
jgi:hypothetical protein